MLLPLLMSVERDEGPGAVPLPAAAPPGECLFCGMSAGLHAGDSLCCAACTLVRHLERPRIDEEAHLVWLPEMSQAALVCLLREIHCRLRAAGDSFCGDGGSAVATPERATLHYTRLALHARAAVAAEHVGTDRPSELAHVLVRMSRTTYDRRHRLLGGLRVLPTGRFFIGAANTYPAVVDSWLSGPADAALSTREAA